MGCSAGNVGSQTRGRHRASTQDGSYELLRAMVMMSWADSNARTRFHQTLLHRPSLQPFGPAWHRTQLIPVSPSRKRLDDATPVYYADPRRAARQATSQLPRVARATLLQTRQT
ncbi:hypothetical protein JDV02_007609 [Purpureocillium takamizusanense]|uniref:Uncharacterized protein n=1 Tax=Purpureocillium takamizusanense TaxID=2060973 RepID=A0A9Q8VDG2_9HYPO|nr:uncharacterized protein JDV02_007609 [Purpureocillium takamizusanense]UNI21633.1 hypothetical protein JDV02_007609 [Purpureocillium takamizusanense]